MPTDQSMPPETLSPAALRLREVHDQIRTMRNKPKPVYVPPPLSPVMAERTRLEMEEGQRRNAMALAARAAIQQPKKDPTEGTTEPVYRPGDHVPNMTQGQATTRSYKTL